MLTLQHVATTWCDLGQLLWRLVVRWQHVTSCCDLGQLMTICGDMATCDCLWWLRSICPHGVLVVGVGLLSWVPALLEEGQLPSTDIFVIDSVNFDKDLWKQKQETNPELCSPELWKSNDDGLHVCQLMTDLTDSSLIKYLSIFSSFMIFHFRLKVLLTAQSFSFIVFSACFGCASLSSINMFVCLFA